MDWLLCRTQTEDETRQARIGIVGMGYVGLPLALLFSGERFRVTGFDIAPDKVSTLNAGGSYIVRILPEAIQEAQKAGFRATADYSEIARMDAVIICVPTPLDRASRARPELRNRHRRSPSPLTSTRASSSSLKAPPTRARPKRSSYRCLKQAIHSD